MGKVYSLETFLTCFFFYFIEIDHCHLSPCMNGGTCMGGEGAGMTTCMCPSGYTGVHCERKYK